MWVCEHENCPATISIKHKKVKSWHRLHENLYLMRQFNSAGWSFYWRALTNSVNYNCIAFYDFAKIGPVSAVMCPKHSPVKNFPLIHCHLKPNSADV